ncbi:hypothetical protein PoB_004165100 [Plakobranchus ocellatus]|uniref:Uncharacterized protein n=1 Tax=Plakobranchus ocellatus TaxID=259542 RepID=A0AAV4AVL7_9GAST|nr:hypothetical protein PoB_004165100 [Plakobranchus ocellatus]
MCVEVSQHEKRLRKLPEEFSQRSFETGVLGGRYKEQMVRVFSKLFVAAAVCRPVLRTLSEKRVPFCMRRAASSPGDPHCGRSIVATAHPQACIPAGPQQPTVIDTAVASVL